MSPEEYQAVIQVWMGELEHLKDEIEELRFLPDLLAEESYDQVGEVRQLAENLIADINRFAWPDARGVRDALFDTINHMAKVEMQKAEALAAKTEERAERRVIEETAELARGFEARLRLHQEEHDKRWKELQEQDRLRRKEHTAAMSRIEAEIERRVEQRLTGRVDEDSPRPKRPLRIG